MPVDSSASADRPPGIGSRDAMLQVFDFSISGQRLARALDRLAEHRPLPKTIVCNNGPEFTGKTMFFWSLRTDVKLHFIQPGKPTDNAHIESFNGSFRDECLNMDWFSIIDDARARIETWRNEYINSRPHKALNHLSPLEYVAALTI